MRAHLLSLSPLGGSAWLRDLKYTLGNDSRQLGDDNFWQKKPPSDPMEFWKKKTFHNLQVKEKRVSGYIVRPDHNEGGFFCQNYGQHLLVTDESHILDYFFIHTFLFFFVQLKLNWKIMFK